MKKITTITPLLFDNKHLIISFEAKWLTLFDNTLPIFDVMINKNGNLCLISKQKVTKIDNGK